MRAILNKINQYCDYNSPVTPTEVFGWWSVCSQSSLSNTAVTVCLCRPLDELGFDPHQRKEISLFSETPGLALGPTQPPTQMATGCSFAVGLRGQRVRLAAQLNLVTSLRMNGALCFSSPYTPSLHVLT